MSTLTCFCCVKCSGGSRPSRSRRSTNAAGCSGKRQCSAGRAQRIDGHDLDHARAAPDPCAAADHAILVRQQGSPARPSASARKSRLAKSPPVGAAGSLAGAWPSARSAAGGGVPAGSEIFAACGQLARRSRSCAPPTDSAAARPVEHVAGELLLRTAVEHVAVLVADVAAGQVDRLGVTGITPDSSGVPRPWPDRRTPRRPADTAWRRRGRGRTCCASCRRTVTSSSSAAIDAI